MNKQFLTLLLLALAAYGQQQKRIAIVNTEDDGEPPIKISELTHLTDRLREIANKTLPKTNYAVMTQQSILAFLGSQENMIRECKESESCLAKLGRKINADYIGQARIGRFGKDLTIKVEIYESGNGNLISSFTGMSREIYGLLSVLDENAPALFKKLPSASGGSVAFPSVAGGISNLERAVDYELDSEKRYVVNLSTEPSGAVLSFNGVPDSRCPKTPCKVELSEGNVRIIANLEQYEIADTTVFIKQNGQSIAIKLKPNFGVLEIKPAYLEGIGNDKPWDLSINDKLYSLLYSLGEINLSPNKYKVKLSHECYENISFNVGINKGKREVFDMAGKIKLKKGGLVLSAERDGEPVIEPVFVNGKQVGETPFSGSVPVCAEIELGKSREKVYVKLKPNEKVTYKHESTESQSIYKGWINEVGQVKEQDNTKNEYQADRTDNYSKSSIFDDANIADANPSRFDKIKFGIGGSLEIGGFQDKISVVKNADSASGFSTILGSSLGIVTSIPIVGGDGVWLTFNPEFYFVYRHIIDTTTTNVRIATDLCLPYCDVEVKEHLEISEYALNIPLIITLSVDDGKNELFSRMYLETGVYLDIPLKTDAYGGFEMEMYIIDDDSKGVFNDEIYVDREEYSFGGILGIGLQFGGLSLGLRGNIGFTNYVGLTYDKRYTGGTPFTVSLIARYLF